MKRSSESKLNLGMMMRKTKKRIKVSECPPPPSFSSLPYDIALRCLARIPRIHYPTLSLVSKDFRSLIASPELYATRSRIGKTEDCLFVCLGKSNPRWFTLAQTPTRKFIPIPSFPFTYPQSSTVVSVGSDIYIIGGRGSRRVFLFDCRSHQWRKLPKMRVKRKKTAVDVIDGKIYVIGGSSRFIKEDWGEIYDPKTQTWEPLSQTWLDLTIQKSVVPGRLVMGGKVYAMKGSNRYVRKKNTCVVEIDKKVMCQICVSKGVLCWRVAKEELGWARVTGLEGLFPNPYRPTYLTWVTSYGGGRRVTVWWKTVVYQRTRVPRRTKEERTELISQTHIWCAEISFERQGLAELCGFVEWSDKVFSFIGSSFTSELLSHSAIVTH